jgi:polyisoprenoid-binding protein YceI
MLVDGSPTVAMPLKRPQAERATVPAPAAKHRRLTRWIVAAVVAVLVIVVGGPFVYFHFIQGPAPKPPSLSTTPTSTLGSGETLAPLAGAWTIGTGSQVQYRVTETLFGQHGTAVGTAKGVTGSVTIAPTKVTKVTIAVDMTSFSSDESIRDGQFQNRIMDTADFPTATFRLSSPIDIGTPPKDGVTRHYAATGKLTMHGTTRAVTIPLAARRTANVIDVQGTLPVTFADYGIDNPSGGPAQTGSTGTMVFVVSLTPASA